jgi:hypothetical protein
MGYVNVAQNRDNLHTVVNTAMETGFHKIHGISCLSEELGDSQDELRCVELAKECTKLQTN